MGPVRSLLRCVGLKGAVEVESGTLISQLAQVPQGLGGRAGPRIPASCLLAQGVPRTTFHQLVHGK